MRSKFKVSIDVNIAELQDLILACRMASSRSISAARWKAIETKLQEKLNAINVQLDEIEANAIIDYL